MRFDRQAGVFCHLTSLPGPHGIGDLGAGARAFVDFLDRADQSLWQFCPLGPTADVHGNSPYQALSAFAGNPLLVDLRALADRGYLDASALDPPSEADDEEVAYAAVTEFKQDRLRTAFERFDADADEDERAAFAAFRERAADWLDDYALFRALRDDRGGPWTEWPGPIRERDPEALAAEREAHADEIRFRAFVQWCFDRQWRALREYAADRGVRFVGDLPIYVAFDSADVWASPEAFDLTDEHRPAAVAGVPPNPGDDGQRWGNPLYDWDRLREDGYEWWLARLRRLFEFVDIARIDHVKGFDAYWAIPADADDPAAGEWRDGPGADFFAAAERELGDLPFVVEDLGFLDAGLESIKSEFDLPGMRVPHYADWCSEGDRHQPMHYPADAIGYTSTHDTDTLVGYYRDLPARQRDCLHFNLGTDGAEINWDVIEAVWHSEAALALTTVPDLLGCGSEARFNTPGTATGNWRWRATAEDFSAAVADRLSDVTAASGRERPL